MKQKKIKNYLKLGILFFGISILLWNCQQEEKLEIDEIQQSISKRIDRHVVSGEIFKKEHRKAFDIVSKLSKQAISSFSRTDDIYSEEHDLYYTLDKVYIIEEEQYQQYSFLVKSSNQLENQFENYLLINYSDDSSKQYVITYEYSSPDKDSYDYVGIRELEGGNLYTNRIVCDNLPELTVATIEVCTYSMCTGNIHNYGDSTCPCGETSDCSPPSKDCRTETRWVMSCGGTDNDPANDDDYNDNDGTDNGGGSSGNDDDDNTDDDDVTVVTVEETAEDRILECMETLSIDGPNITMPESLKDSLFNTRVFGSTCVNQIDAFLEDEGCDYEVKYFTIEAARACLNGGEVDYEDQIILDSTFVNNQYIKCIFEKLKSNSSGYKDIIQNFDGQFPVAHLKFELSVPNNPLANASTSPPNDYIIKIKINPNKIDRPALSIARTFVHETIHAEMWRKIMTILDNGDDLNGLTKSEWRQKLSDGDFLGIFDYYTRFGVSGFQHEQMATHYRNFIENILKDYEPNLDNKIYEALAWVGLKNTVSWNSLNQTQKDEINSILNNFKQNGSKECN